MLNLIISSSRHLKFNSGSKNIKYVISIQITLVPQRYFHENKCLLFIALTLFKIMIYDLIDITCSLAGKISKPL